MFPKKAKRGKKDCVRCGHPVSGGGNQHALGTCPPPQRAGASARNAHKRAKQRFRKSGAVSIQRGVTVAGIHKKSASSKAS